VVLIRIVIGKEGLIEKTQHPKGKEGLEAIRDLEDALNRQDGKAPESEEGQAPEFTSQV
jgi:titin